ncbi:MAG: hypothetical protein LBR60_04725 [Fibrobacter sp.]|jgi:cell division protein FtsL|nr:hypothetical protein [Fibrobacter sp.]
MKASKGQKLLIVVAVIVAVGAGLLFAVWMQARFSELAERKAALTRDFESLKRESVLLDLDIHRLSSVERISEIAALSGLGYENVPKKVIFMGDAE